MVFLKGGQRCTKPPQRWKQRFFFVLLKINDNITSHLQVRAAPHAEPLESSCLLLEWKARCDFKGRCACQKQTKSIFAPQKTRIIPPWRKGVSLPSTRKTTAFTMMVLMPSHKDKTFLSHLVTFFQKQCYIVESHRLPIRSEAIMTGSDMMCFANDTCKSSCQISPCSRQL